jgi:hypothetical protein
MGVFAETAIVDLPTKENKLLFSFSVLSKQTEVCYFRLQQTNGCCRFPLVSFSICICTYVYAAILRKKSKGK